MDFTPSDLFLLLVDDSDDDAFFLERALLGAGIGAPIHRAADGEEAIRCLQRLRSEPGSELRPILVFLDLKMPRMNGFEVLEWIKAGLSSTSLDVVVLSGSDQDKDIQRALLLGASGYLVKPPEAAEVQQLLRARLARIR